MDNTKYMNKNMNEYTNIKRNTNNINQKNIITDEKKPLAIYIHIPFCRQKCYYCDFLSFPLYDEEYIMALKKEIKAFASKNAKEYIIKTIFIGGGTPSVIKAMHIMDILEIIYDNFALDANIEISIETNPGTLDTDKLRIYKEAGINRISMGLQSANNENLKMLGRIHTFEQFCDNYDKARQAGFNNINIDLMSALPKQTCTDWENDLNKIAILKPEHISAYSLIIEEGTKFYEKYKSAQDLLPSEDEERKMYYMTKEILNSFGYGRYEISNYAKEGYECKHNITYWQRGDYKGFGLGASSLMNETRTDNVRNIREYIKKIENNEAVIENIQKLDEKSQMEETVFLGLRMMKGIEYASFFKKFKKQFKDIYNKEMQKFISLKLLEEKEGFLRLTDEGINVSNYIMSEFLLD